VPPAANNATDLDPARLLPRLLRGQPHVTATGTRVTACRLGRLYVLLDADRPYQRPFPPEVAEVAQPIGEDLALLALMRRDRPLFVASWHETGYLHAPAGCAAALLAVLLALDGGDVRPARAVAGFVADAHENVMIERTRTLRSRAAVEAVARLERVLPLVVEADRP
jgi:hypothetical protein